MNESALQFDAGTHTYSVGGVVFPSVTTILKDVGLIDVSQPWYTDWHRDRGTQVHLATALYDEGDLDEESLDPEIVPYLDAWKSFLAQSRYTVTHIEKRAYHSRMIFAGTVDRVLMVGDREIIADIKLGQPERWHGIQTAGYQRLLGRLSVGRIGVHLGPDGKFKVVTHDSQGDHDAFMSALCLYHWKRNHA